MASDRLIQVLTACLSPDPAVRKAAEATLGQVRRRRAEEGGGTADRKHAACFFFLASEFAAAAVRGWARAHPETGPRAPGPR